MFCVLAQLATLAYLQSATWNLPHCQKHPTAPWLKYSFPRHFPTATEAWLWFRADETGLQLTPSRRLSLNTWSSCLHLPNEFIYRHAPPLGSQPQRLSLQAKTDYHEACKLWTSGSLILWAPKSLGRLTSNVHLFIKNNRWFNCS